MDHALIDEHLKKAERNDQFARVLKPGGKLAFFDVIAGEGDLYFPFPGPTTRKSTTWSTRPSCGCS